MSGRFVGGKGRRNIHIICENMANLGNGKWSNLVEYKCEKE